MALIPTSVKFTKDQRAWLQEEANRQSNGRIGTLIKSLVEAKRQQDTKRIKRLSGK